MGLEQHNFLPKVGNGLLSQRGNIVQNPKPPSHGTEDEISPEYFQVGDRGLGQVLLKRHPVLPVIHGNEHTIFRTCIQKPPFNWVFTYDTAGMVVWDAIGIGR